MEEIDLKKIDEFFINHSKRYFLYKRLLKYKNKLQYFHHYSLNNVYKYERKWQKLKRKYKQVMIHGIQFVSIGETIPRLFNLITDIEASKERVLHVVLPTFFDYYSGGIYNKKIFELFGRKIHFIKESNIAFWTYAVFFHMKDISMEQFDRYVDVRLGGIKVALGRPLISFTQNEIVEGEKKLREMGVNGEFICIHARESKVKSVNFSKLVGYESRCLNCNINSFAKASSYLSTINIQSVRMGKYETQKCFWKEVIDYANQFYDEFMDFYLLSRCKFMISCDTGFATICGYWGRPVLVTNMVTICYGGESYPDTGFSMYMPKKFYLKKENRNLNLYEMLDVMDECIIYASNFERIGIELEDNTEDEISEAALEMNSRLDGTWVETEDEQLCYEKYWYIVHRWEQQHMTTKARKKLKGYTMFFCRPSYSYLKRNSYLLDVEF